MLATAGLEPVDAVLQSRPLRPRASVEASGSLGVADPAESMTGDVRSVATADATGWEEMTLSRTRHTDRLRGGLPFLSAIQG